MFFAEILCPGWSFSLCKIGLKTSLLEKLFSTDKAPAISADVVSIHPRIEALMARAVET